MNGADQAREAIERFLAASRQPVLEEPGEEPFPLEPGSFLVEVRNHRLYIQAWDEKRNCVRQVTGVAREETGRLEVTIERFPRRAGTLLLFDRARPQTASLARRGARGVFRERFRLFLRRHFPAWRVRELSSEADLEHSLSPSYPRALLVRGQAALAAIGAASEPDQALAFGLIWLDYLRRREPRLAIEGLVLFLPEAGHQNTCLRLRRLNPRAGRFEMFIHTENGLEDRLDPRDYGNLDTRLEPCRRPPPSGDAASAWLDRLARLPCVERVSCPDGAVSLRVRGLEFARWRRAELAFGIDSSQPAASANLPEIEALARELARLRAPGAPDPHHPLYRRNPERWLESQVRANLPQVDPSLLPEPVYGQVPALTGLERGVIDLVAVSQAGRLAVIELKAAQDIQLPLQALDYWTRVAWHLERGDFGSYAYFPGHRLLPTPPRLLLVAPALEFHPTTETILRYLDPAIEIERVGLSLEWKERVQVMFRLRGAGRPA